MPEYNIREVLVGNITWAAAEEESGLKMVQKRINLPEGYRFQVEAIQAFNDQGGLTLPPNTPAGVLPNTMQFYVTPYPLVLSNESWGFYEGLRAFNPRSGPYAGDNSVLYKRLEWTGDQENSAEATTIGNQFQMTEFPNPMIATKNPFTWYTNHIYLTAVLGSIAGVGTDTVIDLGMSVYIKLNKVKCSALESSIGNYKEYLEAQTRTLTDTANSIDPLDTDAGRNFPLWKMGGIRPELMMSSANTLRYYNSAASNAYQGMEDVASFQTRFKEAVTMVDFDAAFGDEALGLPDWLTIMDVAGVTSGPIRPYPPPVKFTGNGNTVMYDENGQPASVVT